MKVIKPAYKIVTPLDAEYIYKFLEERGRTAYKSEARIAQGTAHKFLKSLITRGHESVLEHFNITVKFICDRGVTHELVRHRLVAYTQESTRYCNYSKGGVTFIKPCFWNEDEDAYKLWLETMQQAETNYNRLIEWGCTPQEARTVLPNSLKTEIDATANIREWRHILKLRTAKDAHPQIREVMVPLLGELKVVLPVLFEDIAAE